MRLCVWSQVVETRLFSEGLHTLGQPPSPEHMRQYLEAYFDNALSTEAVDLVAESDGETLDAVKAKLQRIYSQVKTFTSIWSSKYCLSIFSAALIMYDVSVEH